MKFPVYILAVMMPLLQPACGQSLRTQERSSIHKNKTLLWTIDWSADDKLIATGGDDSLFQIYDGTFFKPVMNLKMNGMIRQAPLLQQKLLSQLF